MPKQSLNQILKACLDKDRSAQARLYDQCFNDLMKICCRYFHNREDAVSALNHGFLKVLNNLNQFDQTRDFKQWTGAIVIRACIDEHRKGKRHRDMMESVEHYEEVEPEFKPVYNDIIERLSEEEVSQILSVLDSEELLVFNMREYEGYTHAEIAKHLGVSDRSSKRYLHRAKLKLRAELEKKNKVKVAL